MRFFGSFDLHVHTDSSPDSTLSPADVLRACRERNLAGVAVTDHNRLDGALGLARQAPPDLRVIVGEEVRTAQGELLGLFLQEQVPAGLDAWETARIIRAQGALVGVPHPRDCWRRVLRPQLLGELRQAGLLDFVEGRNGRALHLRDNRRAEDLGQRLGLPLTAGSDAHGPGEVGACSILLPSFNGPQEFLAALRQGELQGRPSPLWLHLVNTLACLWRGKRR